MADNGIVRFIDTFVAEVTVSERHVDELTITTHPVERGAPITDHAFKNPAQLTIKAGWSAAYAANSGGGSSDQSAAPGNEDGTEEGQDSGQSLNDLYAQLLTAQASATLIEVQTGKRLYEGMLIKSIQVETDVTTENVLMVTAQLQEVLLVETQQTTMPSNDVRADPASASGVADMGTKAPVPYTSPLPEDVFSVPVSPDALEVPLTPQAQKFSIPIAGETYGMTMQYRDAEDGGWMMDLANSAGKALASGIPMVTGTDLLGQLKHLGVNAVMGMVNSGGGDDAPTFANLGISSHLVFLPK